MKAVMIKVHEVWLETLMGAFMSNTHNKQTLFDFADILFRHFTWIENALIKSGVTCCDFLGVACCIFHTFNKCVFTKFYLSSISHIICR